MNGKDGDSATSSLAGRTVAMVPIDLLDPSDSPRIEGEDPMHVQLLAECHDNLPPIVVHRETLRVIDGMHRLHAAVLRGQKHIKAEFFEGSEDMAFVRAVELNSAHGKPLSIDDRVAAATRILAAYPQWSDRRIAATTQLSDKSVASLRGCSTAGVPQLNRTGSDGRVRPVSSAEGRLRAQQMIEKNPQASLRQIAQEAGVAVATARDVRQRMLQKQDVLPPRLRKQQQDLEKYPSGSDENGGSKCAQAMQRRISRQGASKQSHPGDNAEAATSALDSLRKDPSLRMSVSGRRLLQLLVAHPVDEGDWQQLAEVVPSHRTDGVAQFARLHAEKWLQFAQALERRHQTIPYRGLASQ
ncbi:ParB N-terminal domain-containing protein [Streptomyces roseoverticillatus]|uniref:ParB/RepB/Spo0J family partition protein n=1 Tax=Streptomyces roseoverticillatus TaxID=66429 RepID=UPI001F42F817|nr:hypothetical protein [Streptomyces roseoverticillatus]MCF3105983.1 ParB N-terminal domain-containing protein [Streptomyces roseoverticillatus]